MLWNCIVPILEDTLQIINTDGILFYTMLLKPLANKAKLN